VFISIILGLDPGSQFTGYGLIEIREGASGPIQFRHVAHGCIVIPAKTDFASRLSFLDRELETLFRKFRPDATAIEKIFLGKSADSAFKLGHARGVCMMRARHERSEVFEYEARRVKKVVTGTGAAGKEQVRAVIQSLLQLSTEAKMDATDALSLAVCHMREHDRVKMEKRLQEMNQ
jgi:crossover junction endodeoxyribonuclease RuvC